MSDKFKNKYRIESNRLQTWDYSSPGGYFLTVCINNQEEILGTIKNNQMILSDAGKIVTDHLTKIPEYHPRVILDERIVMPHHIHSIIILGDYGFHNGICNIPVANDVPVEKIHEFSLRDESRNSCISFEQYRKMRRQMLIPKIIGKFQMQSSKDINILNNTPGKRNWQRGYHDRVIRNEFELQRIRQYIRNNPAEWENRKKDDEGLWQ